MLRLGLDLTLRGGREALVRLLIMTAAVGLGVALLLGVLALYHAYDGTVSRACWQCTGQEAPDAPPADGPAPVSAAPADHTALWNYSQDTYQGHNIDRADVATLGPHAPVMPGLVRLPGAGEYAASPALARLIATVPADQLRDRFPGRLVATIGPAALAGPDDLAIVIGRTPPELVGLPTTLRITEIRTAPHPPGSTNIYQFGFLLGAVALLVPMLILIGNATRLAAARREERYAAMRLVGATVRQISGIASVDAAAGALFGTILGIGLYVALRPLAERVTITGARFFPAAITPTGWGYAAVLIGVPVASAAAALLSLRRVGISPLGVARRTAPPPPRAWRVLPLLAGIAVFVVPLAVGDARDPNAGLAALGLLLVMVGLMIGGSWLTMRCAALLARLGGGAPSLLAARRLADNPKAAFRSVSGLVLAVLVGTLLAGAVPAALAAQSTPTDVALSNVLRLPLGGPHGVDRAAAATLIAQLDAVPGAAVLPLYAPARNAAADVPGVPPEGPGLTIVDCRQLGRFTELGRCAAGATAVSTDAGLLLFTDNVAALNKELPLVTVDSPAAAVDLDQLGVSGVLVRVDSAATLERIRTYLAVNAPDLAGIGFGLAPQTIGEVAVVRAALYLELGQVVLLIIGLTLLVAGAGLAIAVGGGLLERRRPFTLLRVSGTGTGVLRRVVLLESLLPLLGATVVAAVTGFALAVPVGLILNANSGGATGSAIQFPDHTYYLSLGTGLAVSIAVILLTLPLLNRVTVPANARFE